MVDCLGSAIVDNGAEANKRIGGSNNQLWGVVEKEGDDSNISLLTNSGGGEAFMRAQQ